MGYEVIISFFEKGEDGEFNKEDPKSKMAILGDPLTRVEPEHLAANIMNEFSRPDVWVEKVEIFEWVKKAVSFKEAKGGGVLIGGKKYNPSLNEIMKLAAESAAPPQQAAPQPPQQQLVLPNQQSMQQMPQQNMGAPVQQQPQGKIWPHEQQAAGQGPGYFQGEQTYATNSNAAYPGDDQQQRMRLQDKVSAAGLQYAQRIEMCDPPPELTADVRSFSLTPGTRYQILDEQLGPNGRDYVYRVKNDAGREVLVGWHYFRQPQAVRQEVAYADQMGNLQNVASYVDHGVESQQRQPILSYQNEQPLYRSQVDGGSGADPRVDGMLQKMDAAVQRRMPRR